MVFSSALSQKIQNILSKLRYSYDGQYPHAKKVLLLIFLLYILGICCIMSDRIQDLRKDTNYSVNIGNNHQKYIIYRSNT